MVRICYLTPCERNSACLALAQDRSAAKSDSRQRAICCRRYAKGEIVMIKGGHIVSRDFLECEVTPRLGPVEIQIGDDLFIAPVTQEEREGSMLYSNHSCDANLGLRGNIIFVAIRDIRAGEELTHDWCVTDDDSYEMECKCGSPNCRRILTGKDWQRSELQARYHGYFAT